MIHVLSGNPQWEHGIRRFFRIAPFALVAVSVGLAALIVSQGYGSAGQFELSLLLAAVLLGWTAWLDRGLDLERAPVSRRTTFWLGRWLLCGLLVGLNPWYALPAWLGYVDAARLFVMPWMAIAVVANAAVVAASQVGGYPDGTAGSIGLYLAVVAINGVLACAFTVIGTMTANQSSERQAMIDQLAITNERLETTVRENTGLQAQLLTQAREAGMLDERARMAGEIHDTLAQGLTGIIRQLDAADRSGMPAEERQRHHASARELARSSLVEARRSVNALRPQALEGTPLPEAITRTVTEWSESAGVPARIETTGSAVRLLPDLEVTLLRVAQEALANTARHATAGKVTVTLSYMEDVVLLDVQDDGVGFDVAAPRSPSSAGGFGLEGMRRRLQRVGGELEVESAPGEGTVVNARVPAVLAALGVPM
ncbi:MAG: sensor histidine kinase [Jatrophihabitans sp.]